VLTPVFVLTLASLNGQETFRKRKLAGFAVAVAGIVLLQTRMEDTSRFNLLGDILILLACFSFAMFTVFGKEVVLRYNNLTVNAYAYVGSALLASPLTLWFSWGFDFAAVTWKGWMSILYMAAFPSVICYLIYYYALRFIPATRISLLSYLQPVLATSLAVAFLGEHVTSHILGGGALVLTGVILAERT
jgi:drug/metabolite transporter (DMT)-like permease